MGEHEGTMTTCSNCGLETLHQDGIYGWFCFGCGAVGLGIQGDLRERPCRICGLSTFEDVCYMCAKKRGDYDQ